MRVFKLAFIGLIFLFSSCLPGRFIWYNFSDITDHKIFPSRPLPKSESPFRFVDAQRTDKIGNINLFKVDSMVRANNSVAFLIIRNDSILYEQYYQKYTDESIVASFSAAKSYTSALIGAAMADGFIKDVNEPITNYIPELKSKAGFDKITIEHLLQMTSGIKANESYYNPFGQAARLYYGRSLRNYIKKLKVEYEPGTRFAYRSINTQLLGLIVERATGKSITDYLNEKIWKHLGTETDASWSIDRKNDGLEKTFCCINATARDFAKLGRLYLNDGSWNGKQLVPVDWVKQSTSPTEENGGSKRYKYQWWITKNGYEANGLHGQFIYVSPVKNVIIIRLGKRGEKFPWESLFDQLAERL